MDQTELQQKIAEYYVKLPEEAQKVFSSMQWLETLKQMGEKYGLNDQQMETLGTETTLVLLGIIHSDEYEEILKNEIKVSEDSMTKLLAEINESILNTIRPQLEETFIKNNEEEKQKLDERFNNLSKETKDAIEKSDYQTKIYDIGKKHNLTIYQMGVFGESVINVMLGVILPNKFEDSLKRLELPAEKTTEIVNDVNKQILRKIREELMKNINRSKTEEPKAKSPDEILQNLESREELLGKIEASQGEPLKNSPRVPLGDSILTQKLSEVVQTPKTKTDYSLKNLQSSTNPSETTAKKVDPYREIPE